ncbi:MAG: hypothetical protein MUE67_10770, partial [Anaerolineales bacterium]|nr:hypothetical protein [Anaerolineales bacterium]
GTRNNRPPEWRPDSLLFDRFYSGRLPLSFSFPVKNTGNRIIIHDSLAYPFNIEKPSRSTLGEETHISLLGDAQPVAQANDPELYLSALLAAVNYDLPIRLLCVDFCISCPNIIDNWINL